MTGLRQKITDWEKKTFGDVLATEVNPKKGIFYLSAAIILGLSGCTAVIKDSPLGSYWKAKEEIKEDVRRERDSSQFRQEGIRVYLPQTQMPQYQPGDVYIGNEGRMRYERVNKNYWRIFNKGRESNLTVGDSNITIFSKHSGIPVLREGKPIQ